MRFLFQLVSVGVVAVLGSAVVAAVEGSALLTLVTGVATAVAAVATFSWAVRRSEHRDATEVARAGAGARLAVGALAGAGLFAVVVASIEVLGAYDVSGLGSVTGAVALVGFMAAAATTEEVLFRGILFRAVEQWLGTWVSLVATGLLFGAMHLLNPDATAWGAVAISIEAGFMLAACYAATRTLWIPIGLHFGWNFAAAGVFSAVVSGTGEQSGLLDASMSGSTLVTGGEFGPEGSLFAVAAGAALTLGFMWLARRRGTIVVPRNRSGATVPGATVSR